MWPHVGIGLQASSQARLSYWQGLLVYCSCITKGGQQFSQGSVAGLIRQTLYYVCWGGQPVAGKTTSSNRVVGLGSLCKCHGGKS